MNGVVRKFLEPTVAHRFLASFFFKVPPSPVPVPSPFDLHFQKISGLGRQMQGSSLYEGGDNVASRFLPERVANNRLVMERAVMTITPLSLIFNDTLGNFGSWYADVLVMVLNDKNIPVSCWRLIDASPVSWQTGDLDSGSNTVLINRLELAYRDMSWMGVKA